MYFAACIADLITFGRGLAPLSLGNLLALPGQYRGLVLQEQQQMRYLQGVIRCAVLCKCTIQLHAITFKVKIIQQNVVIANAHETHSEDA